MRIYSGEITFETTRDLAVTTPNTFSDLAMSSAFAQMFVRRADVSLLLAVQMNVLTPTRIRGINGVMVPINQRDVQYILCQRNLAHNFRAMDRWQATTFIHQLNP